MSYNGSGTFLINTAGQPVVSGTVISSTAFNALTADLATGLSTAITKDGQTTVTANIPMANYKFTGLGAGSGAADSANLSQVQSTVVKLLASVSGTDTITAVGSPTVAAYAAGQMFYFVAAGDNTGAVTINIDSLGAKAVTRDGSVALAAGDIKSGEVVVIVYDGTRFQVVSQLNSSGDARFANVSIASALNVGGVATFSAGTAAAPAITTTGDTNTGIFFPAADTIAFAEGGVEAMRIDSSGNVGINDTSPSTPLSGQKGLVIKGTTEPFTQIRLQSTNTGSTASDGFLLSLDNSATPVAYVWNYENQPLVFGTNNTERLRITSAGDVGIGTSSPAYRLDLGSGGGSVGLAQTDLSHRIVTSGHVVGTEYHYGAGTVYGYNYANGTGYNVNAKANVPLVFHTNNAERARITSGGALCVGSTDQAGTGAIIAAKDSSYCYGATSTTANTSDVYYFNFVSSAGGQNGYIYRPTSTGVTQLVGSSDVRLKENIVDATFNGIGVINAVKVREFDWKETGHHSVGFIAQELYEACSDAVAVGEDDEDGNIKRPWGVSREALVPYLVKAIQEQQAMIDELKAEVAALKGA